MIERLRIPSWPRYERDVWLLSLSSALIGGSFLGMMSLLMVLYMLRLGFGPEFVGVVLGAGSATWMLGSLVGGALGDRYGTRRTMIGGALLCVVGITLLPLTETVPLSWRAAWLLLAQLVVTTGWAMLMVNQIAAMMAFTTVENRQGAYAMREAMTGFGIFAGMLVGGMLPGLFTGLAGASLDHPAPYRCALWVAVVMALIGLVPLWMIRPAEVVRSKDGARKAMPPLLPLILLTAAGLLTNGAVATCRAFASAYLDRVFALPPSVTGAVSSVGQILAVPASLSVPYLARRHRGSDGVMIVASFGLTAFLLLVGLGRWWGMAGLGIVGVFALSALWTPAYQILQMEMSAPEWRATVAGAASTAGSLGFGLVSFGGGYIATAVGYHHLFLLGALLALLSGLVTRYAARRSPPAPM